MRIVLSRALFLIGMLAAWAALSIIDAPTAEADDYKQLTDGGAIRDTRRHFDPYLRAARDLLLRPASIERFLSDNAAVVSTGAGRALVESSIPLRTISKGGEDVPLDLDLQQSIRGLRPRNPLVQLSLPSRLGEGFSLPEIGVRITPTVANLDSVPSIVDGSVAIYPNTDRAASVVAVPLPSGLETYSVLHGPSAPRTQVFELEIPSGSSLESTPEGGAEVRQGGRVLLSVLPPTAVDADGDPVQTTLEVVDDSLRIQVFPNFTNTYPFLVDPVYQTYIWSSGSSAGLSDWGGTTNTSAYSTANTLSCGSTCVAPYETNGTPGLYVGASPGTVSAGATAYWSYFVPRYQSDKAKYGQLPTSFISKAELSSVMFFHRTDAAASPVLFAGLWGSAEAPYWGGPNYWTSQVIRYGNQPDWTSGSITLENPGNNSATKWLLAGLAATDNHSVSAYRDAYFGAAKITLADSGKPSLSGIVPPTGWFDQVASAPIPATAEDTGLGVSSFTSKETASPFNSWQYSLGCAGTVSSPCPRIWKSSEGSPVLLTWPSALPEGISTLAVTVADPVGNVSAASTVEVKVDHSPPAVTLGGTLTEPGAKRLDPGEYSLNISATDGVPFTKPRSGVKSIAIEVDGKMVPGTVEQTCAAGSCPATRNWIFDVQEYTNGDHVVKVVVKDQVGRKATSELKVQVDKSRIYWGAWMSGQVALMPREGEKQARGNAPWDTETWSLFEEHAGGKKTSIVHFGQPPPWILYSEEGTYFQKGPLELASQHGTIPLVDMRSDAKSFAIHVSLDQIAGGAVDKELEAWAKAVKAYGKPFFLRWDWEMNLTGEDFIWAHEAAEEPSDYVSAWRHFHDVATEAGATNITWVWCPNVKYPGSTPLSGLWPGGEYVDWTCLDGYNWGTNPLQPDSWKSFGSVFGPTYEELLELAPSRPIMIGETASTEIGGNKAQWITDALTKELPANLPKVKAFAWFNWNDAKGSGRMDWPIESSEAAEDAFAAGIASPVYAEGGKEFENLPALAPILPLP